MNGAYFWIYNIPLAVLKIPMHSVGDKILKKLFEVYDTDSPVGEVQQLNFYYEH